MLALTPRSPAAGPARRREEVLERVSRTLPGLGEPTEVRLPEMSTAVGRTIGELGLRGHTGATILAILRDGDSVPFPGATARLRAGDTLALAGTHEAVTAASALLGAERG